MKKFIRKFTKLKIKTQLVVMYFVSVCIPILAIGIGMVKNNVNTISEYNSNLINQAAKRVGSVMYEMTSQAYNISTEIINDEELINILSAKYANEQAFRGAVMNYNALDNAIRNYSSVYAIELYTNQKNAVDYGCFKVIDDNVRRAEWYKEASEHYATKWYLMDNDTGMGSMQCSASLVRKIPIYGAADTIIVVKLDNNYIKTRVQDSEYNVFLSFSDGVVFYSNDAEDVKKNYFSKMIDPDRDYFNRSGPFFYKDQNVLSCIKSVKLKKSDDNMYITLADQAAYANVAKLKNRSSIVIGLALLMPAFIMSFFIWNFNRQISDIRTETIKVSSGKYNQLGDFEGCVELTKVYDELNYMIGTIKEKDEQMYAKEIAEQKLQNEQQKMEFQMLASQINPHFLYNTLEMIRMKAISAKDKETATAIKLLGKSMRYVLDNTGIEYTTLAKEFSHIETYLQIQRLRFGDRVNYFFEYGEGIDTTKITVLPLLLQPIVENSILHGLEEVETGGQIKIQVYRDKIHSEVIHISITDNGCGMSEEELEKMRRRLAKGSNKPEYGIGLYNINQRIRICYGEEYGLTVQSELGVGTTFTATIREM